MMRGHPEETRSELARARAMLDGVLDARSGAACTIGVTAENQYPGRVVLHKSVGHAEIIIDNPQARHALTVRMMRDLCDAVTQLVGSEVVTVLLRSSSREAFCSGGHLDDVQRSLWSPDAGRSMSIAMTAVLDTLRTLPMISAAVISGPAIGGGAELATACDFRILSPDAVVHFVQARLGVAPGWGGAARLVDIVGRTKALQILAQARPIRADDALSLGLADLVHDDPAEATSRFLEDFRAIPAASLRAVKQQIIVATAPTADRRCEADIFATVWSGPAHAAALDRLGRRG